MSFRPMLAAKLETTTDLISLIFPMLVSGKIDGIRCIVLPNLGPVSRNLKPIPNLHIRSTLAKHELTYLDGELTAGGNFQDVSSSIMTFEGKPDFTFWVFDHVQFPCHLYYDRYNMIKENYPYPFVKKVPQRYVSGVKELLQFEEECLAAGFEGIMVRSPTAPYKEGRSTVKEQFLFKLKRWADAEAEIIGFEVQYANNNELTRNIFGLAQRTSHQAGMVEKDTLGKLKVRDLSGTFSLPFHIGSGLNDQLRYEIWNNKSNYLGKIITFKYFNYGIKDKPRFPIFKGFRQDI